MSASKAARDAASRGKDCIYKVTVITGDKKGAGTDAKVSKPKYLKTFIYIVFQLIKSNII